MANTLSRTQGWLIIGLLVLIFFAVLTILNPDWYKTEEQLRREAVREAMRDALEETIQFK